MMFQLIVSPYGFCLSQMYSYNVFNGKDEIFRKLAPPSCICSKKFVSSSETVFEVLHFTDTCIWYTCCHTSCKPDVC